MSKCVLLCGLLTIFTLTAEADSDKKVICYYGTWATYRPGDGKFDVEQIQSNLCTHLVYTFVGLNTDGTVAFLDPYLDLPDNWGRDNFGKFNALKEQNPSLKTILAVGGWNEASAKYSTMANDPALRKIFVESATKILLQYGFDGFDVDWEYPNRRDSVHGQVDVDNFTQLLKELKEAFNEHGLLLTAAVASVQEMASLSYDIPAISTYLDLISVMAYDMHGAWDTVNGHNAPLHRGEGDDDVPQAEAYTVDVALKYWLDQGCPPEKLMLGLPLYGRTFTLSDANNSSVRAPISGEGIAGPYTRQNGVIGYNEMCINLQTDTWDVRYDDKAKVPYAVKGRDWVSFDNAESLTLKVQHGLNNNIGGIMVWSIETDDFHGLCHTEDNHLLRTINRVIGRDVVELQSTPAPATEGTTKPASQNLPLVTAPSALPTPDPTDVCQEEGLTGNPEDCHSFYFCTKDKNGNLIANKFTCPNNLVWDQSWLACNYPEEVDCQN